MAGLPPYKAEWNKNKRYSEFQGICSANRCCGTPESAWRPRASGPKREEVVNSLFKDFSSMHQQAEQWLRTGKSLPKANKDPESSNAYASKILFLHFHEEKWTDYSLSRHHLGLEEGRRGCWMFEHLLKQTASMKKYWDINWKSEIFWISV